MQWNHTKNNNIPLLQTKRGQINTGGVSPNLGLLIIGGGTRFTVPHKSYLPPRLLAVPHLPRLFFSIQWKGPRWTWWICSLLIMRWLKNWQTVFFWFHPSRAARSVRSSLSRHTDGRFAALPQVSVWLTASQSDRRTGHCAALKHNSGLFQPAPCFTSP